MRVRFLSAISVWMGRRGKGVALELLNEVLPLVFYVMQNCEVDSAFSIVQFLLSYVGTLKSVSSLGEEQLHHLAQIL